MKDVKLYIKREKFIVNGKFDREEIIFCSFMSENQLPLFMVIKEYRDNEGNVEYAETLLMID